jgi:hypothetical protein
LDVIWYTEYHFLSSRGISQVRRRAGTAPKPLNTDTAWSLVTFTGHSLRDVEAILDAHYLGHDVKLAEMAVTKLWPVYGKNNGKPHRVFAPRRLGRAPLLAHVSSARKVGLYDPSKTEPFRAFEFFDKEALRAGNSVACTRFRRRQVGWFNGTGGASWSVRILRGNSRLRLCNLTGISRHRTLVVVGFIFARPSRSCSALG